MTARKKTSFTIPVTLDEHLNELSELVGVSKSDVVSMSVAFMSAQLSYLHSTPRKRHMVLREVGNEFQKLLDKAKEGLNG